MLVAGIGNVFLGDDGFGVEVVRRLDPGRLPDGVDVVDYGIRGVHLAYDLLDGRYDTVLMVDAVPLGEPPGTLAVLEVPLPAVAAGEPAASLDVPAVDGHGMPPQAVVALLHTLGGRVGRVLVVGCQPAVVEDSMQMSDAVCAAVDPAVGLVTETVTALLRRVTAGAEPEHAGGEGRKPR